MDNSHYSCPYFTESLRGVSMSDTETTEPTPETAPETKPAFEIETLDDVRRLMIVAKGGDPDAIQAITNFMDLKSNAERSYFPDKKLTIAVGQLNGFGKLYYPVDEWDPFTLVSDVLSITFMGYKGFKSNQFVDMTRQTPNLDALQTTLSEEQKQGVVSRILGRGKE